MGSKWLQDMWSWSRWPQHDNFTPQRVYERDPAKNSQLPLHVSAWMSDIVYWTVASLWQTCLVLPKCLFLQLTQKGISALAYKEISLKHSCQRGWTWYGVSGTALSMPEVAGHDRHCVCACGPWPKRQQTISGWMTQWHCVQGALLCVFTSLMSFCCPVDLLILISFFPRISCMCSPPPSRLPGQVMPSMLSWSTGGNWTEPRSNQ